MALSLQCPRNRVICAVLLLLHLLGMGTALNSKGCGDPMKVDNAYFDESISRYMCMEGYKRKAGTSNLAVCKGNVWKYGEPTCIRDPSLPPLTTSTFTVQSTPSSSASTISTSTSGKTTTLKTTTELFLSTAKFTQKTTQPLKVGTDHFNHSTTGKETTSYNNHKGTGSASTVPMVNMATTEDVELTVQPSNPSGSTISTSTKTSTASRKLKSTTESFLSTTGTTQQTIQPSKAGPLSTIKEFTRQISKSEGVSTEQTVKMTPTHEDTFTEQSEFMQENSVIGGSVSAVIIVLVIFIAVFFTYTKCRNRYNSSPIPTGQEMMEQNIALHHRPTSDVQESAEEAVSML